MDTPARFTTTDPQSGEPYDPIATGDSCPNCGADATREPCIACATFGAHGGPCGHGVRVLSVEIGPTAANGFVNGEATMTVAASTDEGHAALVATLQPEGEWIEHRSYMQSDGTYRVTFTYRPTP